MTDTLPDHTFTRDVIQPGDLTDYEELNYDPYESVRPKFGSVAALLLHMWSLSSFQDEDCGDAQLGNGWHALFRSERAILHTDNSGFVSAWRIPDDADVDTAWEEIEKGARYFDGPDDADDADGEA